MFLPKKHADLPIEPSVLDSLRAQEKSLKREKRKAAKERRQHAKQLKKAEKHAKKRIAARKAPQKASDCLQYLSMSQDGICEVEPGLFSMTMAFTDVNFQIAMLEEQKNIFTKYSEFLNYFDPSLHLEINLVTRSMDEEQFRRDTFLPLRGDDRDRYAEEMNQVVAEKALRGQNGLIREKYVTFSLHAENYQQAKEQLENRAADIADHFKRMGSSTRILSGIERLSLLQGIMRPNEEMRFSYDWLLAEDDLTTKDFISPSSYNWHPEHDDSRAVYRDRYQFGDKIGKTMYLRGIAPEMKNGLFSMLSELPFDHVITMHVDAMDQAEAVQEIEKKLAYMHKEEYDAIAKARERNMPASIAVSYDLKSKMHHTEQMMDDITTKNQKIFKVCILIHTYGDSNAQLDERVRRICSTVQQQTCRFDSILYEQRNAMNSMLPLGKKWLGLERTLETVSTAIYVPFTTQELFQPGGLYEGINARSKNLILCNRKLLPAPAGMVLGMTGYGKSFSVMQMVTNIMLRWPDDDIVLIDPEQEYTHLVTAMGGVVIDISASSPSHINPMDITEDYGDDEDPIRLKSQFLQNFCQLILHSSELSPQERTFIDVAAGLTYQRYMANPKREEMPTLHEFYRNLALQGEEVKPLLTALKLYVSGSMDLFAHQTNVNVQNHCICFNTVKLGKSMQSIGMLALRLQFAEQLIAASHDVSTGNAQILTHHRHQNVGSVFPKGVFQFKVFPENGGKVSVPVLIVVDHAAVKVFPATLDNRSQSDNLRTGTATNHNLGAPVIFPCKIVFHKNLLTSTSTHSYTGSKKVSGWLGLKISLQVITVTRFSVSDRLMMLWVQPGIMWTASILSPETSNSTVSPVLMLRS